MYDMLTLLYGSRGPKDKNRVTWHCLHPLTFMYLPKLTLTSLIYSLNFTYLLTYVHWSSIPSTILNSPPLSSLTIPYFHLLKTILTYPQLPALTPPHLHLTSLTISFHNLPSLTLIYYHLPSLNMSYHNYHHLHSLTLTYLHIHCLAITNYHLPSLTLPYSLTVTCPNTQSLTFTYHYFSL